MSPAEGLHFSALVILCFNPDINMIFAGNKYCSLSPPHLCYGAWPTVN